MKPVFVALYKSPIKTKKYRMIFYDGDEEEISRTDFGARGMSDFTIHKDPKRKERYLTRHKKRENWNAPMTAGALSRWILWNEPTLEDSFKDYLQRFDLEPLK
jgi:hypothetical protein